MRIDRGFQAQQRARGIDMALHHVAAQGSTRRRGQLQIHQRSRRKQREGSAGHRLRSQVGMKAGWTGVRLDIDRRQAHTAHRDAVTRAQGDAMTDGPAMAIRLEPSRCSTASTVPVVSISPVNIST